MAQKKEVPRQQKIALGVLALIGLYMLYSNYYAPLSGDIRRAEDTLREKRDRLADMRVKAADIGVLEKELEMLKSQLSETEEQLPQTEELPGFIRLITRTASKYGMDIQVLSMAGVSSEEHYNEHRYGVELTSDYHTLASFFAEVGGLDRVFNIRNLSLAPSENPENGDLLLDASFILAAFTFEKQ